MRLSRLYRGVGKSMDDEARGLMPRGTTSAPVEKWGDSGRWDDGGTWGPSDTNGVIAHQRGQGSYPDSAFLSTTPSFERAKAYALHKEDEGVVYVIDVGRLDALGIRIHRVTNIVKRDVAVPEDDEHALLSRKAGPLPQEVVIEVIAVSKGR